MSIGFFLVLGHIIGTILGVGGATMIEAHLAQALKDKLVSGDEKAILAIDYRTVRIGLILCVLTGFGFLLVDKIEGHTQYLYSARLWAKILIVLFIAANTLLLQAHAINLYWGSAISFVSWWTAAVIGIFITNSVKINLFSVPGFWNEFVSLMLIFATAVIIGAVILNHIRSNVTKSV